MVMGVLNVTPDSFSDGGRYADLDAAVAHGVQMHRDGADLVDVGGESTRPGALRVDEKAEVARVLPVIRELAAAGVPMSIDTTRASVAAAALAAGVSVVNDVSGGLADPQMAAVVVDARLSMGAHALAWALSADAQLATYGDVVKEVCDELQAQADAAQAAGVPASKIILDPGLGFAKHAEHNWQISAHLDEITGLGFPVLVGASRKSYLGLLLAGPDGVARPAWGREAATVATSLLAVQAGVWGVRVHDVLGTVDALRVLRATRDAR